MSQINRGRIAIYSVPGDGDFVNIYQVGPTVAGRRVQAE